MFLDLGKIMKNLFPKQSKHFKKPPYPNLWKWNEHPTMDFAEECCEAILKIMENGKSGHSYNIGTENSYSNLELLNRLISILISKNQIWKTDKS